MRNRSRVTATCSDIPCASSRADFRGFPTTVSISRENIIVRLRRSQLSVIPRSHHSCFLRSLNSFKRKTMPLWESHLGRSEGTILFKEDGSLERTTCWIDRGNVTDGRNRINVVDGSICVGEEPHFLRVCNFVWLKLFISQKSSAIKRCIYHIDPYRLL